MNVLFCLSYDPLKWHFIAFKMNIISIRKRICDKVVVNNVTRIRQNDNTRVVIRFSFVDVIHWTTATAYSKNSCALNYDLTNSMHYSKLPACTDMCQLYHNSVQRQYSTENCIVWIYHCSAASQLYIFFSRNKLLQLCLFMLLGVLYSCISAGLQIVKC